MQTTFTMSGLRVLIGEPSQSLPARADRRALAWVQGQAPPEGREHQDLWGADHREGCCSVSFLTLNLGRGGDDEVDRQGR